MTDLHTPRDETPSGTASVGDLAAVDDLPALMTDTVVAAFDLAAAGRTAVHSGSLVAALARASTAARWDELWLASSSTPQCVGAVPDTVARSRVHWRGCPLSITAACAVQGALRLARTYDLGPVSPGLLTLAILRDPRAGATRAMSAGRPEVLGRLLEVCQDDLLGVSLDLEPPTDRGAPLWQGQAPPPPQAPPAARPPARDELDLVVAATHDRRVGPVLATWGLDAALVERLRPLTPRSEQRAAAALERETEQRRHTSGSPASLLRVAAEDPSPAMEKLCSLMGASGPQLAAQLARWEAGIAERREGSGLSTKIGLGLVLAFGVASTILVVADVVGGGSPWVLVLLLFAFSGYPFQHPAVSAVATVAFGVFVGPVAGAVKAAHAVGDVLLARGARAETYAETGIRLSLGEQRRLVLRLQYQRPSVAAVQRRSERLLTSWEEQARRDGSATR